MPVSLALAMKGVDAVVHLAAVLRSVDSTQIWSVNVEGTRDFFTRVQQPDKKMIIYEGGYHESHNDIHYQQVVADIEAWLEAHL